MTRFKFSQAVKIDRKVFSLGIHDVSAEFQKHAHFQFFLKGGVISPLDPMDDVATRSFSDLKVLPPATTEAARRSRETAKNLQVEDTQETLFGEEVEPSFEPKKKKGK